MQTKSKRLLVILAHPDDESFAMGGTLAKYAHQGVQVILLCATRGEAGIAGVTAKAAGAIRERELRNAAQQLGIEVHFLGYMDGELASTPAEKLLETISGWLERVRPQVMITFGPDGVSGHPDHVTVSQIVTRAYDQRSEQGLLLYIHPSEATVLGCGVSTAQGDGKYPLLKVDISEYKLEKARAIQAHASQTPDLPADPDEAIQKIPCSEVYAIARASQLPDGTVPWFESALVAENQ